MDQQKEYARQLLEDIYDDYEADTDNRVVIAMRILEGEANAIEYMRQQNARANSEVKT